MARSGEEEKEEEGRRWKEKEVIIALILECT